ncbi:MAG: hydrogenase maturation nickel metallochaperone HypA [Ignavibacteriales bacterium]|nr:hydrogenase maturation nickel metallochaperone HypA [Ignavibacteriales bacterium]
MHESSIAQKIIEIVKENLDLQDINKLSSIKVKIGKLSNIFPNALLSAFNSIIDNTPFYKTKLDIEISPIVLKCGNCDFVFSDEDFIFNCKKCGSNNLSVITGDELELSELILNS